MRPPRDEGTTAMKIGAERAAVRSRGEDTGLEPVPETGPAPTAKTTRGRDGVRDTDAARYRKVFACSAGDSPDEEQS
jgi:hypothetical protein